MDRLDALADERAKEWTRIGAASFLTEDEKREAVGYGPRVKKDGTGEGGDVAPTTDGAPGAGPGGGGDGANGGAWRNQPRDAEGRWTDMGGGASAAGANSTQLAQNPNDLAVVSSDQPSPSFCKLQKIRCLAEASDATLPTPMGNNGWNFFKHYNACMEAVGCLGRA